MIAISRNYTVFFSVGKIKDYYSVKNQPGSQLQKKMGKAVRTHLKYFIQSDFKKNVLT